MPRLLWDASALIKRYALETGTEIANALFTHTPALSMVTTYMGYAEACASLKRKRNSGILNALAFTASRLALEREILSNPTVEILTIEDADILNGVALTDQHNINSTDAAILATFLRYAGDQPSENPPCLLIASDHHLIRAATAENLPVLNPEVLAIADFPSWLANWN